MSVLMCDDPDTLTTLLITHIRRRAFTAEDRTPTLCGETYSYAVVLGEGEPVPQLLPFETMCPACARAQGANDGSIKC